MFYRAKWNTSIFSYFFYIFAVFFVNVHCKNFKILTNVVSSFNFMNYLFCKNVFKQSIRLNFFDVWMKTYSKFIKTLNEIKKSFSIVIVNFFFNFKQIEIDENNDAKKVVKNDKHIAVRFNIFNFNFDAKRREFVYIR